MKTFVSIGAGPGVGLATAERFAREGFAVVLCSRSEARARELASRLANKDWNVEVRPVDAADATSVATVVSQVETEFDGIDVLHYNVAAMRRGTLLEESNDEFISDLLVNIGGAWAAARAAAAGMMARGSGSILLTGGGYALSPNPEYLSLSIGKAAIRALAHGAFRSLEKEGVHIGAVTITGAISSAADRSQIAECFWRLHSQPVGAWEAETIYAPGG